MENKTPVKKILILAANPKNTPPLRLDQELRDIEEGLRRAQKRDQFSLEQKLAVRPRDIQRALLDIKPQIIHFSGHGKGEEGLVFEDEIGQSKLVSGFAIAGLFKLFANQIECVVLNGCYSEEQAKAIVQDINYVIGMRKAIGDRAAVEFAVGFYDALGAGESVEFAYNLGCAAIQLAGIEEHLTPVLLKKPQIADSVAQKILTLEPPPVQPESVSQPENRAIEVFFSYAHEDEKLRDELAKHLRLLERQKVIKAWYDRDISAGDEWKSEIEKQLNSAQIILLLVSSDFLASDFCWSVELERAMQRHEAREARVIPIILREVDWHKAPFGKLQALPKNAEPVTNWANCDQAFTDIARGISRVVQELSRTV
ncbi:MAG: TIR domain-containing protein [Nostoc sp.]|uniref:TIR domain-containing protein n=1 Tax=Nostoc sp. TaxID=1180 RepID=UPI002FEFA5C3